MIEYLYNIIKATSGEDLVISAELTDTSGNPITSGCCLLFYDNDLLLNTIDGIYNADNSEWIFIIPAIATEGLSGRYFYSLTHDNSSLCFKQPFYLN